MERLAGKLGAPLTLIARLLLSMLFLMAGLAQIGDVRGFAETLAQDGVPVVLGGLVFWFLILSGLLVLIGAATRPAALAQSGFCLASGLMAYGDLAEPTDMTMLLKNISLTGGYLMLALHGPGRYSVDAWLAGRKS